MATFNPKIRTDKDFNHKYFGVDTYLDLFPGLPNLSFSLDDGLFNKFFVLYDECLRIGMHKITCGLNLTSVDINEYDFFTPVLIKNSRYIPSSLRFEVSDNKIRVVDAEFLLLH